MCVIYRPPTIASTELQFMYDILPELSHNCDVFICTGEFNVNFLNQNTTDCQFFCDILQSFGLVQLISNATRINCNSNSLLDLILTNRQDLITDFGVAPCDPIHTDHEAVYCRISCDKIKSPKKIIKFRNLKNAETSEFLMDLANLDWHDLYVCNNINTKVDIFNCKVLSQMDKHCPMITFVEGKPKPPWLTPVLKRLIYLKKSSIS